MADVSFPFNARLASNGPRLARQRRGGGFSISGVETVVPSFQSFWEMPCMFYVHGERAWLQWASFVAQMDGGIGTTVVPIRQKYPPVDLRNNYLGGCRDVANLDQDQTFEHFGFQNEPVTYAQTTEAAALRATRIKVTYTGTTGLRPGHKFSFEDRLYMVQREWVDAEGVTTLEIKPPLRAAVASGQRLNIDYPVCRMRFSSGEDGWPDDAIARVNAASVLFREAL